MTLFEINKAIDELIANGVDENGEILPEIEADLNALQMVREDKIENIGLLIKNLKAEAEAIKAEKMKMAARQATAESKVEWLKNYLQAMTGGTPYKCARVAISFRKSEAVVVNNVYDVPENFLRYKEPEVDKTAVKQAIKAGEVVPGCAIEERASVVIK